jgi:hypothetical protein
VPAAVAHVGQDADPHVDSPERRVWLEVFSLAVVDLAAP